MATLASGGRGGGAWECGICRCPLCLRVKVKDGDSDEEEQLQAIIDAGKRRAVTRVEEMLERVYKASAQSRRAACERVRMACKRAEDAGRVAWIVTSDGSRRGSSGGGEVSAVLASALGLDDAGNVGREAADIEKNSRSRFARRASAQSRRNEGEGDRGVDASSAIAHDMRVCELEELIVAAAVKDTTRHLFCLRDGRDESHLRAWIAALEATSALQSLVSVAQFLTLVVQLRAAGFRVVRDDHAADEATCTFAETLLAMTERLTADERHFAFAFFDVLEELARRELRQLACVESATGGDGGRKTNRVGIALKRIVACERFRRSASGSSSSESAAGVSKMPEIAGVAMYTILADAARARFEALENQNARVECGTFDNSGRCTRSGADGEPREEEEEGEDGRARITSLEDVVGPQPCEQRWRSLRATAELLSRLIDAEVEEERGTLEHDKARIIDIVGMRPLSIAAGTWADIIQERLRDARGGSDTPSTSSYNVVFSVYKVLIGLERQLATLIEDDRALGDSGSDGDSDSGDETHVCVDTANVLMLEKHFAQILVSWGHETKGILSKVVARVLTEDEHGRRAGIVDGVVSVYTSLFDTVDLMGCFLRVSATAACVMEDVVTTCILEHARRSTTDVTQLNEAQQQYVTSATVGLTPMRKKSATILRRVIAKAQAGGGSTPTSDFRSRHEAICAIKLAEVVFHRRKSGELLEAIRTHAAHGARRGAQASSGGKSFGALFAELFAELDSLYRDVLHAYTTSLLIVSKNGTSDGVGNTDAAGNGFVKSIMKNEVENMKGIERKIYKAIKAVRAPTEPGFSNIRRNQQQSVDEAVDQCAECLRILASRLQCAFATPVPHTDVDTNTATTRRALVQAGPAATRAVLMCIQSRVATAVGDAASAFVPCANATDDGLDDAASPHADEPTGFRVRRWSSASSSNSGGGSSSHGNRSGSGPVNTSQLDVATSTLDQLEKVVHLFAESIAIVDLETPKEVNDVRTALTAAQALA